MGESLAYKSRPVTVYSGSRDLLDANLATIDIAGLHRRVRDRILPIYPAVLQTALKSEYLDIAGLSRTRIPGAPHWHHDSWARANLNLHDRNRQLKGGRFALADQPQEVRAKAARCARICRGLTRKRDHQAAYAAASKFAISQNIKPPIPAGPTRSVHGCLLRLTDDRWWRRVLKRAVYKASEEVERDLGLVQARAGLYASDDAVNRRQADRERSCNLLQETYAVNELGESFSLAELAELSVSNPVIRRTELMVRLRGFEEYGEKHGHIGEFFTLTLPSRFHAFRRSGQRNPRYEGRNPGDGQAWLNSVWARIRARLHRLGIPIYGVRVAEPHHDGTPHWHMLLYFDGSHQATIHQVFRQYLLAESPDEPGALAHRLKIIAIDPEKGSATGYFAKYISKNIDGHKVGQDLEDHKLHRDAAETSVRVEAWASLWRIRQFQQIGGPPVGVWRELRRLRAPAGERIEPARQAADQGDWCAFMEAMGGISVLCQDRPIRILKVWSDLPGIYGDPVGFVIDGIESGPESLSTRLVEWKILWGSDAVSSRTCVNNCTEPHYPGFEYRGQSPPEFDRTGVFVGYEI